MCAYAVRFVRAGKKLWGTEKFWDGEKLSAGEGPRGDGQLLGSEKFPTGEKLCGCCGGN
jgi:hypothetical protein